MNTPAHLIFGMAAFAKAGQPKVTAAAFAGALIPDLSLYLMAGWHLQVLGTSPEVVFGQLYFSDAWQSIFRIDNSMFDFLLHHDDGRAHFWPVTNWIFQSPVSYWDGRHYGNIVGPIEILASLVCCVVLWRRFKGIGMRLLIAGLGALEFAPVILFAIMFSSG